jgi:hypothetical protein
MTRKESLLSCALSIAGLTQRRIDAAAHWQIRRHEIAWRGMGEQ